MTSEELRAEIAVEFAALRQVANELEALRTDVVGREPTVREKTAAAAFLAQFYPGMSSIMAVVFKSSGTGCAKAWSMWLKSCRHFTIRSRLI